MARAIQKVNCGGVYLSSELQAISVSRVKTNGDVPPHERLSAREFEVLLGIGAGHGPKGIANRLSISEKTASTYRERMLRKMRMRSDCEVVLYVAESGLSNGHHQ